MNMYVTVLVKLFCSSDNDLCCLSFLIISDYTRLLNSFYISVCSCHFNVFNGQSQYRTPYVFAESVYSIIENDSP